MNHGLRERPSSTSLSPWRGKVFLTSSATVCSNLAGTEGILQRESAPDVRSTQPSRTGNVARRRKVLSEKRNERNGQSEFWTY